MAGGALKWRPHGPIRVARCVAGNGRVDSVSLGQLLGQSKHPVAAFSRLFSSRELSFEAPIGSIRMIFD